MSQTSAGRRPRSAARRRRLDFEPQRYRSELAAIIHAIGELPEASNAALDRILRRNPRDGRGFFSRSQLISGYRYLAASVHYLRGSGESDNKLVARTRAALGA